MKWIGAIALLLAALLGTLALRAQTPVVDVKRAMLNSKHDFRAISTASIRSVSEGDPCVFCHTPHNADPGPELWNHQMGTTQFATYTSSTLQAAVGQMSADDSSKLCLSCHDGTIALGSTVNEGQIPFLQGTAYQLPASSPNNLAGYNGKGFADDHPFAFLPNLANTEIRLPAPGDAVKLEVGKVQCISCHDPHTERLDSTQGKFLVKNNQGSALCLTCHVKTGWTNSAHQQPPDALEDQRYTFTQGAHTGYVGVANNGCESCHRPHAPGVSQRLVKFLEENTCYQCHDGSVATIRLRDDFTKTYRHPADMTPSVHDAAEGPLASQHPMPETSPSTPRHAECEDCHNPHMGKTTLAAFMPQPPAVNPPLLGVKGESAIGSFLPQATNEYEICFKCHADSANKPQLTSTANFGRLPSRQYNTGSTAFNQRLEFSQSVSYHPVTRARAVLDGSLRPYVVNSSGSSIPSRPLNSASMIFCTDCHASDTNRDLGAGNTGARGPHGSNIPHLLERQDLLETPPANPGDPAVGITYSVTNYALCDKCHDVQGFIYLGASAFSKHKEHLDGGAACSTCHDPHASSQSPRLINFDLSIVGSSSAGAVRYSQISPGHGTCTLKCHGRDHDGVVNPNSY